MRLRTGKVRVHSTQGVGSSPSTPCELPSWSDRKQSPGEYLAPIPTIRLSIFSLASVSTVKISIHKSQNLHLKTIVYTIQKACFFDSNFGMPLRRRNSLRLLNHLHCVYNSQEGDERALMVYPLLCN